MRSDDVSCHVGQGPTRPPPARFGDWEAPHLHRQPRLPRTAQIEIIPHRTACISQKEQGTLGNVLKFQRDCGRNDQQRNHERIALFTPRSDKPSKETMTTLRTACLVATIVVATTTFASAQGDRNGNAIGSEHVGNGGGTMGGMSGPATGTTGMNTQRSRRDSPNGSLRKVTRAALAR
jgi:hypothetical protein